MIKIWVDDVRPAPEGYEWLDTVNKVKNFIMAYEETVENALDEFDFPPAELWNDGIELISLDHDAGDRAADGGDYIKILDWLEETGRRYPICIHSQNPVGVENMRRIIERNGWEEVR